MNRLPKYRAFLKTEKKMYEVVSYDYLNQTVGILREFIREDGSHRGEYYEDIVGLSEVELMQSTGLKDCNGREMFESDILRHGTGIYKVVWEHGGFCCEVIKAPKYDDDYVDNRFVKGDTTYGFWDIDIDDIEVIGSAYGHPELLKQV